ncbi:hypothetical protein SeLEV6574_g04248 [Synchytrium endobioticum]|uniref:Carboxypeptidase M14A n=1 Tax=Synchytrium endobioticum TaxID=286115 RepID=A0A507D0B4_9FUNG|nr:hypothetical protein SeLEV6574_g04248 [Synchytrium endobioticum]
MLSRNFLFASLLLAIAIPSLVFLTRRDAGINGLFNHGDAFKPASFEHHQVWRIHVDEHGHVAQLWQLTEDLLLDAWTPIRVGTVDIRVDPLQAQVVAASLHTLNMDYDVIVSNVQTLIDQSSLSPPPSMSVDEHGQYVFGMMDKPDFFKKYHTLDGLIAWMKGLEDEYPDLVAPVNIGKSFEGRDITGIRISLSEDEVVFRKVKKEFVFHGGIHAREWISPATVTYMANEIITRARKDDRIKRILGVFDFTVIPVLNVDGYVYTHTNNRMWRKNRQPNPGSFCIGTDGNRNFDYEWNHGGSSSNPCSEAYMGSKPFSAPEPLAIANYVKTRAPNVLAYIDFHSFSQLWMYPFGSDCNERPSNRKQLQEGGEAAAKAIKAIHGTSFAVGGICQIIYQASGSSTDYMYANGNISYSYAAELRDTGRYGFLLPPKYIIPSGEEILAGLLSLSEYIIKQERL